MLENVKNVLTVRIDDMVLEWINDDLTNGSFYCSASSSSCRTTNDTFSANIEYCGNFVSNDGAILQTIA